MNDMPSSSRKIRGISHGALSRLLCWTLLGTTIASCGLDAAETESVGGAPAAQDGSLPREFHVSGLGVALAEAGEGRATRTFSVPATVGFDESRRAMVLARVEGVVTALHVGLGDSVESGTALVYLDSRELATARIALVDALRRTKFAEVVRSREERLFAQEATSESELVTARRVEAESSLAVFAAREALLSLGVDPGEGLLRTGDVIGQVESAHVSAHTPGQLPTQGSLSKLTLRAPISGTVIAVDVTLGEAVTPEQVLLEVADLSRVWVEARVPVATLAALSLDDEVRVRSRELGLDVAARIDYVDPRIDVGTQSALARVIVMTDGAAAALRPGLFVELVGETAAPSFPVTVPALAVQRVDGEDWVFVAPAGGTGGGTNDGTVDSQGNWEARRVELGRRGDVFVEVLEGVVAGESVAVSETLVLKSVWLGHGGEDE